MLRVLLGALCAIALAVPATVAASETATAAKTCSVKGKERKLGATYVTSLSAKKVSCGKAEGVVKAFHACRLKHGKAGRCTKKVKGFSCREVRSNAIPTQFDAKVTCKDGGKVVKHNYEQFT